MEPLDVAKATGLVGYAVEGRGIGGIIKARVADFRVEEVTKPIAMDPKGRFTVARVTLTNWETNRFVLRIAKILGINRQRIFFAGTKDKRAVTTQTFIIDAPVKSVAAIDLDDVQIEILGRTHQKLGFGNHLGNRFTIVVRGCAHSDGTPMTEADALEEVASIKRRMDERFGAGRFPNRVGPQRFGSMRPVTATVGTHVLRGDWQTAVRTYIGLPGRDEETATSDFRAQFLESGVTPDLIEAIPPRLDFEAAMVRHLHTKPDDWFGAFRTLPNNLQLMMVHAVQSRVFNEVLARRLDSDLSVSEPEIGDIVAHLDDRAHVDTKSMVEVEAETIDRIRRNCLLERLAVTGPLPGASLGLATGAPGRLEQEALDHLGLSDTTWVVERIGRLTTNGTRRGLTARARDITIDAVPIVESQRLDERSTSRAKGVRWHPDGACVRFRFTLTSGVYATSLLREHMRQET